jgi:hypothetical protein
MHNSAISIVNGILWVSKDPVQFDDGSGSGSPGKFRKSPKSELGIGVRNTVQRIRARKTVFT